MTAAGASHLRSLRSAGTTDILKASCIELHDAATDFFTQYHALHHLRSVAQTRPDLIDGNTLQLVQQVFKDKRFARQRQSLFFFRQAAEVFTTVIDQTDNPDLAARAFTALGDVVRTTTGNGHRAAVEAIGALPARISGPKLGAPAVCPTPSLSWHQLLNRSGVRIARPPEVLGRSLVAPVAGSRRLLVVKLARKDDDPHQLARELDWMQYLARCRDQLPRPFQIPRPLDLDGNRIFKLTSLPVALPAALGLNPQMAAIGFTSAPQYYTYPNSVEPRNRPDAGHLRDIMRANARLLARLASRGIVHTAPIALFHNRIQTGRRRDRGRYEWFRAGRLDRWLASCDYPNLGMTGIRDFEHLTAFTGNGRQIYRRLGNHLLSLVLVAGSYFRNSAPDIRGLDQKGDPVDARHLFDRGLFRQVIEDIFHGYYKGFVGSAPGVQMPLDLDHLTDRLIEELGVDRYMEEVLRAADQDQMSPAAFAAFLLERGHSPEGVVKGEADIVIHTGPHLGGFNQPISIPELIEAVGTLSAWCIAGRFWKSKFGCLPELNRQSVGST